MLDLLRADEMDVAVESAGGEDFSFAGDDVGAGADHDGYAGLDIRIAGLADGADITFLDGDVGLDDAPVIDDQRIGDDSIGRALFVGDLGLSHAVADHLAAAEFYFFAVDRKILLDLDDEIGVGQPHPIAGGRPEHVGIDGTFYFYGHQLAPAASNMLTAPPPRRRENHTPRVFPRAPPAARRGFGPARTAPRCRRRYRA